MYDFSVRPSPDSSPGALKAFWKQVHLYATDEQKRNLGPAPELPKSQHTMVPDYQGQSYRQFAAEHPDVPATKVVAKPPKPKHNHPCGSKPDGMPNCGLTVCLCGAPC